MYARHVVLVASAVTTVTMDKAYDKVEIVNKDAAGEVHGTTDGTTPTVDGNDQLYLPAAIGGVEVQPNTSSGGTVVKLISTGTPKVYVRGF
jgi:hypothetical protein